MTQDTGILSVFWVLAFHCRRQQIQFGRADKRDGTTAGVANGACVCDCGGPGIGIGIGIGVGALLAPSPEAGGGVNVGVGPGGTLDACGLVSGEASDPGGVVAPFPGVALGFALRRLPDTGGVMFSMGKA